MEGISWEVKSMEMVVNRMKDGFDYLTEQGKQVSKIIINQEVYNKLLKENKADIKMTTSGPLLFGVPIEGGEVEKFEYILS